MPFVQITDLHFVPGDQLLYGTSPKARLAPGIDIINSHREQADFVLVTGDLAHDAEPAAYENLKNSLSAFDMPAHLMLGNHDSRKPFRAAFPDTPVTDGGFVQYALDVDGMRILCLDSLHDEPGEHQGTLCDTRLKWLQDQLAAVPQDTPLIVAVHHPPFDLGLPNMDDIRLREDKALLEVFQTRKPDLMLFGHVHRPISGNWQGIPFHIQRAFNHQVALVFSRHDHLQYADMAPDIGFIRREQDAILAHTRSLAEGEVYSSQISTTATPDLEPA